MLAWVLLAALGVRKLSTLAQRRTPGVPRWIWVTLISTVVMVSPTVHLAPDGLRLLWPDTAPFHLMGLADTPKAGDLKVYSQEVERLAKRLEQATPEEAILWSNANYAGGLAAALAGRPTSSAMFYEVPAQEEPFDPIAAAWGVVWFKIQDLEDTPPLALLIEKYGLQPVAEDPLAVVYRTASGGKTAERPKANVPLWLGSMVLCSAIGAAVWDLRRKGQAGLESIHGGG